MTEYYIPTQPSKTEFTEKRSRFIGHVWPVSSEEEARAHIQEIKTGYHDARHHCWCYLLREGGILRYSDDGEPQGTAGQPMLEMFRREQIENVCCVVTRYFGGILLGTGGLVRAYVKSAQDALDAAGVSVVRRWIQAEIRCPYAFLDRMKLTIEQNHGILGEILYTEEVQIPFLLLEEESPSFSQIISEQTAGRVSATLLGDVFRAVPRGSLRRD